jgi:RNA polymerase sigma factor (TIGR02999 family)
MADVPSDPNDAIARVVARAEAGDVAAKKALFDALYEELHRLAQAHIRRTGGPLTLSATTLLHEAYLDIAARDPLAFPDRNRFLGYASRAMRGLIVDYVRHRTAQKRGGDLTFTTLSDEMDSAEPSIDLGRLDTALKDLASLDPALAELVDLKFFCGFSFTEIAVMRNVSDRTIQRDWAKARAVLHDALRED